MGAVDLALLVAAVVGAIARPRGCPAWLVPVVASTTAVAAGRVGTTRLGDTLQLLAEPLGFLLAAVPLAVLLDRLGFFRAAAALAGGQRSLVPGLWLLAGVVTAVLNLDAAVVLLTPLYIQIARRRSLDPIMLAFIPALQACLASSLLPVSNLTNLLAAEHLDLSAGAFLTHLGLPTLAATAVGLGAHFIAFGRAVPAAVPPDRIDLRALRIGGSVVVVALAGFTIGGSFGVEPWMVALAADIALLVIVRTPPPWRHIPVGTAALALCLAVLAGNAARHADLSDLLDATTRLDGLRTFAVSALGAAAINNLPAVLVGLESVGPGDPAIWPLLLGVNIGPLLLLTGSLSNLLWQQSAATAGVRVDALTFTKVGLRVGLPALAAAGAVHLLVR